MHTTCTWQKPGRQFKQHSKCWVYFCVYYHAPLAGCAVVSKRARSCTEVLCFHLPVLAQHQNLVLQ